MDSDNPVPPKVANEGQDVADRQRPEPGAEDQNVRGKQPSESRKVTPWIGRYGASLIFLGIAGFLALLTKIVLPMDTPIYAPEALGVSTVVSEDPIKELHIYVSDVTGGQQDIMVGMDTLPHRNVVTGHVAAVTLLLPQGVRAQRCHVPGCQHLKYTDVKLRMKTEAVKHTRIRRGTAFLTVSGPQFSYNTNGVTTAVQLPWFFDVLPLKGVTVEYGVPDAESYDWSGSPAPSAVNLDSVTWEVPLTYTRPPTIYAFNHDAQSRENVFFFVGGILLGTCGAALIAATQEVLRARREERDTQAT